MNTLQFHKIGNIEIHISESVKERRHRTTEIYLLILTSSSVNLIFNKIPFRSPLHPHDLGDILFPPRAPLSFNLCALKPVLNLF